MGEDQVERGRDRGGVHHQHHRGSDQVGQAHEGNQRRGHNADAADTAENHQADHDHGDQAGRPQRHREGGFQRVGHAVDLHHVANAEAGQPAEDGERSAKPDPLLAQPVLDGIHRAADVLATVVLLAVVNRQHDLAVLGGHTDQRGAPHPEQRARAAEEDRRGDAGDVAGTYRCGQRRHQRLERADLTGGFVALGTTAPHQGEAGTNAGQRHELEHDHQHQAGAKDQDQHGRAPDEAVNGVDEVVQKFHSSTLFLIGEFPRVGVALPWSR